MRTLSESQKKNRVLFDWLTAVSHEDTPEQIIDALGLSNEHWRDGRGLWGYKSAKVFENIMVMYDGSEGMGVCVSLSGKGCRAFETYSSHGEECWENIFCYCLQNNLKITRLDVAYDDFEGILPLHEICTDTLAENYVSRSSGWDVHYSDKGTTCVLGSKSSLVYIRIYDKAAEQKLQPGEHWVRTEIQMRDDRARNFAEIDNLTIGEKFAGVLLNYLRFVQPDDSDTNKRRWAMKDYWSRLVEDAASISIASKPKVDYSIENLEKNVCERWGNAIYTLARVVGWHSLRDMVTQDRTDQTLPAKYELVLSKSKIMYVPSASDDSYYPLELHEVEPQEDDFTVFEHMPQEQLEELVARTRVERARASIQKQFNLPDDLE